MRGGINSRGYTILEVMIFMAISGLMFIVAANFISNKQVRAEFNQSISLLNSDISRVVDDVGNGYYDSAGNFSCTSGSSGGITVIDAATKEQGTNSGTSGGCVFMGKMIEIGPDVRSGQGYNVHSVAGRQYISTVADAATPLNFNDAQPQIIKNLTDEKQIKWNVTVTKVTNHGSEIGSIGFFNSFGSVDGNGQYRRTRRLDKVVTQPVGYIITPHTTLSAMDSNVDAKPKIVVCLKGNGPDQFATINIGGDGTGQRFATKLKIYNNVPGDC